MESRTFSSVPRTHRRISLLPTLVCASYCGLGILIEHVSYACHLTLQCQAHRFLWGTTLVCRTMFVICRSRRTQSKGALQAYRKFGQWGKVTSNPCQSFILPWNADY